MPKLCYRHAFVLCGPDIDVMDDTGRRDNGTGKCPGQCRINAFCASCCRFQSPRAGGTRGFRSEQCA